MNKKNFSNIELKVIISAGGTGGHIFPAIATANKLKEIYPNIDILFVGAKNKMEMEKIPQAGYKIIGLNISGYNRKSFWKNILLPIKLLNSFYCSYKIIKKFNPNVVVGFGGYVSFTTLRVAQFLKIPTTIHEQNSIAGKSNKLLSIKAKNIFVAYNLMHNYFSNNKIVFSGNPVRKEILNLDKIEKIEAQNYFNINNNENKKILLIIGGSLGSNSINQTIYDNLTFFEKNNIILIWQCGKDYKKILEIKNKKNKDIIILEFIQNIEFAYSLSDIIISRAGALSISELSIVGKPVIFIPYPYAAEDHQTKNATNLVQNNAALIITDGEIKDKLIPTLNKIINNNDLLNQLSDNIKKYAITNADTKIAEIILHVCNKNPLYIDRLKNVFILGIGGAGISALAKYCLDKKITVTGYDKTRTKETIKLEKLGAKIIYEDNINYLPTNISCVIYTPSIPKNLKILQYYQNFNCPIIKRSQFLGVITKNGYNICICGSHGKTTISTLMAHILKNNPLGCSAYLGGVSLNYNSNYWINNNSKINVIEADEYDKSFLQLKPNIIILTALDSDHLDIYHTHENMVNTYFEFLNLLETKNNLLVVKYELTLKYNFSKFNYITYSTNYKEANYFAYNIQINTNYISYNVNYNNKTIGNFKLNNSGLYNIENSLPVIAVSNFLEIDFTSIENSLNYFKGIRRRFEFVYVDNKTCFIDDYAHHPEELKVAINSIKKLFPNKKITTIFQPHLYSRTLDYAKEFAEMLSIVDTIILLPIYPARELPIEGVDSRIIFNKISIKNKFLYTKNETINYIKNNKSTIEVLLTVGAGDISDIVEDLKNIIKNKNNLSV